MYQLPACVGNWSVISPCPFLPPWAFCCISSSLPAKEGSTEGFWGHLVSIWGNAPPWDWYMTKKDRIPLNEIFSEETTAIFNYPSCRYAQEIKLLKLWTWLFFHWKKKGSFQVCLKKTNYKHPRQETCSANFHCLRVFLRPTYKLLKTGFTKEWKHSQDLLRSHDKGLSTWSLHWAQPKCSSPSSLHTGQHCLCRWCRDAALKAGWH